MQHWWNQHGPRTLWLILLCTAAIFAVLAALIYTDTDDTAERVDKLQRRLASLSDPSPVGDAPSSDPSPADRFTSRNPSDADAPLAQAVARIRDRHLFTPAPPEAFRNVQGILGDQVLYAGGQTYSLGDQAMGATITAIGSNWVEFVKDQQKVTIDVFRDGQRGPERLRWDGIPNAASLPEAQGPRDRGQSFEGRRSRFRSGEDRPRRNRGEGGFRGNRGQRGNRGNPNNPQADDEASNDPPSY